MGGVIIAGRPVQVPNASVLNWLDDSTLRLRAGEDMRLRRASRIRGIVLHTTKGIPGGKDKRPQVIKPGLGASADAAKRTARYWSTNGEPGGAHLVLDFDGTWACLADLEREATYHATQCNDFTIGIEIYQGKDAELYEGQLQACVVMLDFLTRTFGIQRQFQRVYHKRAIPRLLDAGQAITCVGIYGHRDCSNNRGLGDPGDRIFALMKEAGYEPVDFAVEEDRTIWRERQAKLGLPKDGIPGDQTLTALTKAGHRHGMWVRRPGDEA